ncbi:MAG: hypothetical protein ACXABY_29005 [Candidatus Thorarchaeota archaeon]|jgi:hypothetical protein
MCGSTADDLFGDDPEYMNKVIDDQKAVVKQLNDQLVDMDAKPIKYLNSQINTLMDFMSGSINPSVHMVRYQELTARRKALIDKQIAQAKVQPKLKLFSLYNSKGDVIHQKYLPEGITPQTDPEIQGYIKSRQTEGKQTFYDVPNTVKMAEKFTASILGSPGMSAKVIGDIMSGNYEGATDTMFQIYSASQNAVGGETAVRNRFDEQVNSLRGIGVDIFNKEGFDPAAAKELVSQEVRKRGLSDEDAAEFSREKFRIIDLAGQIKR